MTTSVEQFKQHILDSGYVMDAEGTHHEFVSGMHGRKLDFDKIPDDSPLFSEWIEVAARTISTRYRRYVGEDVGKLVIVSVANGTNRVVEPIAETIGKGVTALKTEKVTPKSVELTNEARDTLSSIHPEMAVIFEDVGTSGETTSTAAIDVRNAGVTRVEALATWQRREQLEKLEAIKVPYGAIIKEALPTYTPQDCRDIGYCALNWEFIARAA